MNVIVNAISQKEEQDDDYNILAFLNHLIYLKHFQELKDVKYSINVSIPDNISEDNLIQIINSINNVNIGSITKIDARIEDIHKYTPAGYDNVVDILVESFWSPNNGNKVFKICIKKSFIEEFLKEFNIQNNFISIKKDEEVFNKILIEYKKEKKILIFNDHTNVWEK